MGNEKRGPIVDACVGCNKVEDGCCKAYLYPAMCWRRGNCPLASHLTQIDEKTQGKRRVGQQKHRKGRF